MSRRHGTAGRTLQRKLILIGAIVLGTGAIAAAMVAWLSPFLAPLAPMLGLIVVLKLLQDREIQSSIVRFGRGFAGERSVGRALSALPGGWRVFHDVDLGGENADHVVVSSRGVFTIEVKNYSGRISVTPNGLYTHGKRNDLVVKQAWRQAHKLRERLGVEVEPLLVFVGSRLDGDRVGHLRVMTSGEVVPYLLSQTERKLEYEVARRLFSELDALTSGPTRRSE